MYDNVAWFGILGACNGVASWIFYTCFYVIGQKVSYEFRWRYLKSILTQDANWFDQRNSEELPTQIHAECTEIENASGKTFGLIIFALSAAASGVAVAFFIGWVLASCLVVVIVMIAIPGGFQASVVERGFVEAEESYRKSGAHSEQAINAIKVVKAFGQENRERRNYERHLKRAQRRTQKQTFLYALAMGILEFTLVIVHPYAWLIGGTFIIENVS